MSFVVKDRVKETTTTHSGTGTFTLNGAVSGFQAFSVIGNSNTCPYVAEGATVGEWEVGIGTYTLSGTTLARTTVLASSNSGSLVNFTSGVHTVFCGWSAAYAQGSVFAQHAIIPGGRLTLTSGTPITTSDVTGATSIYYTPYVSNVISLWTGARWQPIEFSEYTLALGTISNAKPYDVFAYLNAGALACELLAWTNDTTRATAITIQDGRYCKSGDKTRLYLGTFYTTSTTTTADALLTRYVFNHYNKVPRQLRAEESTSHTYTTGAFRSWNNSATNSQVKFLNGIDGGACYASNFATMSGATAFLGFVAVAADSTTGGPAYFGINPANDVRGGVAETFTISSVGLHYISANEYGQTGCTYGSIKLSAVWWS